MGSTISRHWLILPLAVKMAYMPCSMTFGTLLHTNDMLCMFYHYLLLSLESLFRDEAELGVLLHYLNITVHPLYSVN